MRSARRFSFAPEAIQLAPGEHRIVELTTRARRPLTGSPMVRVFTVNLDERHLLEPGHDDAFWALVAAVLPAVIPPQTIPPHTVCV